MPLFRAHFRRSADSGAESTGQATSIGREEPGESAVRDALIDLSVEGWRFARRFGRLLPKLDAGEASRYDNQKRYFEKKVDEGLSRLGLSIVNLEGQTYVEGMAASPLNGEDFGPDDTLVVEEMVEPIVMGPDGPVRRGTVVLTKADPQ
jgi:hypothetical protein